jgi:hypothetical protein
VAGAQLKPSQEAPASSYVTFNNKGAALSHGHYK